MPLTHQGALFANTSLYSVTIVSILRLSSLVTFANSNNPTWDQWGVAMFSTVEINVGVICACMPSLRLLLKRVSPKIMGSNSDNVGKYGFRSYAQSLQNKFPTSKSDLRASKTESLRGLQDEGDDSGSITVKTEIEITALPAVQESPEERQRKAMSYLNMKPLPLITRNSEGRHSESSGSKKGKKRPSVYV